MNSGAVWFIFQNHSEVLVSVDNTLLTSKNISNITQNFLREFYLGSIDGVEYYCAELAAGSIACGSMYKFMSFRDVLVKLDFNQFGIAVKAYSIVQWDRNHKFCGSCGAPTIKKQDYEKFCQACKVSFYPRISPSIIVLIHNQGKLVMARSHHYKSGVYGLIAGFIEVGETAEEAVHREVQEEVGLKIKNLSYFGSQPWPFPDCLMLGYLAEYDSGEIQVDAVELAEAGWFEYDKLPGRPSMPISIASKMLDYYLDMCNK